MRSLVEGGYGLMVWWKGCCIALVEMTLRVMKGVREERGLRTAEDGENTNVLCLDKYVQHDQTKRVARSVIQEAKRKRKQHATHFHNLYPTSIPQA